MCIVTHKFKTRTERREKFVHSEEMCAFYLLKCFINIFRGKIVIVGLILIVKKILF